MSGKRKGRPIQIQLYGTLGPDGQQRVTINLIHPGVTRLDDPWPSLRRPDLQVRKAVHFSSFEPVRNLQECLWLLPALRAWWRERVLREGWQGRKARRKAYRLELKWWDDMVGSYLPILYYQTARDTEIARLQKRWGHTEPEQE